MNTIEGRENFNSFQILLDSGFISTIVMGGVVEKLRPEKYSVMQWHTQARNVTTNLRIKNIPPYPHLAQNMS